MARGCWDNQEGHVVVVVVFSRLHLLRTMHVRYLMGLREIVVIRY